VKPAALALGVFLLAAPATGAPVEQEVGLAAAVARVGEGRFAAALEAARGDPSPLDRAQAELYVLHQGGALEAALEVGLAGLAGFPEDPWLLDRSAYLALSLGDGGLADELYGRLEALVPDRREALAPLRAEARQLEDRREAEARALGRAQTVVLVAALAALALMAFGLRPSPSGPLPPG